MTAKHNGTRRTAGVLQLAAELTNVNRACQVIGCSQRPFHEVRRDGLIYAAKASRADGPAPTDVAPVV